MAEGRHRVQHRPQLTDGGLPLSHVSRVEQVDGEAGKAEGQKFRKSGGRCRKRALLHRRRGQRANVVFQSFARCLETTLR